MDVPKEVFERMDMLSEKLGIAVEHLWPAAVAHTVASGWAAIIVGAIIGLGLGAMGFVLWRRSKTVDDEAAVALVVVAVILWIIAVLVFGTDMGEGIPKLLAPEGATIKALLG